MPPVSVEQLEKPIISPTTLERHWKFWRLEKTDRPIIGLFLQPYLVPDVYRIAADDDLLEPQQIKAELYFDLHLERHQAIQDMPQDFIRPVEPLNWMPWLEAILGLPLKVKNQSVWAEPVLNIDQPLREFQPGWSEDWMETALAYVRDLVNEFHPRIPVAGPFLRGPADVVSAMLGTSRFCVELVDHPEEIQRLVSICALAWIKVSRAMMGLIPDWQGGSCPGARWIHAPGVCVYTSEDATSLISRKMYEKHFLPANMQMSAQFPYGFVHRHSAAIHNLESLCLIPQKWAVEVTLDPSGPALEKILPVLQKVQQSHHPLIVFGISEPEPLHFLSGTLLPEGLCLILQSNTADQARMLLESFVKKNK